MKTLSLSEIKLVNSLDLKKYRQKYNKFIVEGHKIVNELVRFYPERLELLISDDSDTLNEIIKEHKIDEQNCRIVNHSEFKKLSKLVSPQSLIAVVNFQILESPQIKINDWYIYLDGVQDPGNVGTIIRTADWFGIRNIIFSKGSVDPYNHKVVQSSMGSIFRMNFHFLNLMDIQNFQDFEIWGADLHGESLYNVNVGNSGILCVGSEGEGLSQEIRDACTSQIFIPGGSLSEGQSAESLNVAIATGIILSKIGQELL